MRVHKESANEAQIIFQSSFAPFRAFAQLHATVLRLDSGTFIIALSNPIITQFISSRDWPPYKLNASRKETSMVMSSLLGCN
jgi:hypothetical protein